MEIYTVTSVRLAKPEVVLMMSAAAAIDPQDNSGRLEWYLTPEEALNLAQRLSSEAFDAK